MGSEHIPIGTSSGLDINGLTYEGAPVDSSDYLVIYDASAGANKKTLIEDLPSSAGGNAFTIIQPDSGTSPAADSSTDTLTLTSSDDSIDISGNSTNDTIDFKEVKTDKSFLSSAVGAIAVLITRLASQTADLFRIADESDNDLFAIKEDGTLRVVLKSNGWDGFSIAPIDGDSQIGINFSGTGSNSLITMKAGNDNAFLFSGNGFATTGGGVYGMRSGVDGVLSGPAYTFDNDRSTGMYRNGSNTLGLCADGVLGLNLKSNYVSCPLVFWPGQFATGSLPAAADHEGGIAYDTTTKTMKWSNGTAWATI